MWWAMLATVTICAAAVAAVVRWTFAVPLGIPITGATFAGVVAGLVVLAVCLPLAWAARVTDSDT